MRSFGVLFFALLISLAANGILLSWNNSLRSERDAARAEVIILEQARAADAHAISVFDQARTDAAATAQRRRDALSPLSSTDSDSDVLQRCRDGLCLKNRTQGADTTPRPVSPLSAPVDAGSPAAR